MVIVRCLSLPTLPTYRGSRCCSWPSIGRIVVVVTVFVVAAVLAVKGYPPDEITGEMLVLVAGAIAAADRLVSVDPVQPACALPTS